MFTIEYSALKKNEVAAGKWMELEIMLSDTNQAHVFAHIWNLDIKVTV
jgi:hypothetical protein